MKKLMSASDKETGIIRRKRENDLRQTEKRKTEVDALFARLYEDWAVGRITEYNFNMLSAKYQDEQIELDEQLEELRAKLDKVKQTTADAGKWLALIRKYANPMELTAPLLNTLRETAPYFAKALGEMMGNTEPGLRRVEELLCCPECGEKLSLENKDENKISYICQNGHHYDVTDGVIYFGSREIPGELWSLYMKNYQDYLREQCHPGNPRYQMGTVPCNEMRWQALKKLRPRVILDIACGTCNGLKYDLQRINWPCLVIMTDLSHRILKYNKRYFSEEMVNPYVDIVCLACDCAHLPIRDGCVDMVVSNGGFESMQSKMMEGFREGYRVLKPGGYAIYNISIVGDHDSENTKKWERLYRTLDDSYSLHEQLFDIEEWEKICRETGYASTETKEIYGELPAPEGDVFPFENEIMQWMGEYLCVSEK